MICLLQFYVRSVLFLSVLSGLSVMNSSMSVLFILSVMTNAMSVLSVLSVLSYIGGGGQPHFTSFYLIPILPFLAARMR